MARAGRRWATRTRARRAARRPRDRSGVERSWFNLPAAGDVDAIAGRVRHVTLREAAVRGKRFGRRLRPRGNRVRNGRLDVVDREAEVEEALGLVARRNDRQVDVAVGKIDRVPG